ncbi:hypothetical protein SIPHO049v1_p0041 [Vibrio phage PS14A.1]|nr:hypothetical protein SIPHO049v1_p0041 [Vibrio phage PS14A.1]
MGYPSIGSGRGSGVAATLFQKKDGTDAIFASTGARDAYFRTNPDELKKIGNSPVGIGSANAITAAYVYDKGKAKWRAALSNLRGKPGAKGKPGSGIEPSLFSEGSIPKWDSAKQELVDSGLISPESGELMVAPSSILFGNHSMSSSVENVVFRNKHTHRVYAPVWQEVAPGQKTAYLRAYDANIEKVVRVPAGDIDVINPVNSGVTIDKDEIFLGGEFILSQPATKLMLEVFDTLDGELVWRQRLGDHSAGSLTVTFKVPFDVRKGFSYDIKLLSEDGSDVVAKSNANTGFSWTISRATWKDSAIATQDWVNDLSLAESFDIEDGKLKITFTDGAVQALELPAGTGGGSVVIPPLTADMVSKAIDHGVVTNGSSIKGLADGWWVIPASATQITGRPSGSQGDLTYFKQSVGKSYTVAMAFGTDKNGASAMWVKYKNVGDWTSWLPITGSEDLTVIQSDLAALKIGDAAAISRIERLETQIGKIYAPSKVLFDSEANTLIDAKLSTYVPPKDPQIAQLQQELDELKRRLPVTPGGGGVLPVTKPEITVMFTNRIPSSITDNSPVSSTTGEVRMTRTDSTPLRLWVLVENDNDEADRVKGISVNKGMEAVWQSRDIVIGGKKYRAFYSAGAYTETEVSVQVNFEGLS